MERCSGDLLLYTYSGGLAGSGQTNDQLSWEPCFRGFSPTTLIHACTPALPGAGTGARGLLACAPPKAGELCWRRLAALLSGLSQTCSSSRRRKIRKKARRTECRCRCVSIHGFRRATVKFDKFGSKTLCNLELNWLPQCNTDWLGVY